VALSSVESASKPPQPGILTLKLLQTLGLGQVQAAEFALPVVEGCLADPMLAAKIGRLRTQLVLALTGDLAMSMLSARLPQASCPTDQKTPRYDW
jgi:hypothetical protein